MATKRPYGWTPGPLFGSFRGTYGDKRIGRKPFQDLYEVHPRLQHKKHTDMTPAQKCPCEAFTVCDYHWHSMNEEDQDYWNDNVKKPKMSGYQFFMKECICLVAYGENFPDIPSVSGGFTCNEVEPGPHGPPETIGAEYEPPEECIKPHLGNPCPECKPDTPAYVCITIRGIPGYYDPPVNRMCKAFQEGACWYDTRPTIYCHYIYYNVEPIGRERVGQLVQVWDPTEVLLFEFSLEHDTGEDQQIKCWDTWVLPISSYLPHVIPALPLPENCDATVATETLPG